MNKKLQKPSPFTKGKKSGGGGGSSLSNPGKIKEYEDLYMGYDLSQNPYQDVKNTMTDVYNPYGDATNVYGEATNPYADQTNTMAQLENPYTGQVNPYENLGNAYEGLGNVYSNMDNAFDSVKNPWAGAQNKWADVKAQMTGMENQYLGLDNQYTNLRNQYKGMENAMEDMGVSTEAAEFAVQKQAQSRANIMSALSGAAGGSGISALAQTMANQASSDSQQASVDIARQEIDNEKRRAQEQSRIDTMQRGEESRLGQLRAGEEARLGQLKAGEEGRIDQLQRQELSDIDRLERGGAERLQSNRLGSQMQLNMARAQSQQAMSMAEAGYQGQLEMQRAGTDQENQFLKAQEAGRLDQQGRDWISSTQRDTAIMGAEQEGRWLDREALNQDRYLDREASNQDRYLDTELQLDLGSRAMDFDISKLMAEGDKYTQGLEMDRISTMLQGALGIDASKRQASAQKSSAKSGAAGQIGSAAVMKSKGACIPAGTLIDCEDGKKIAVELIKPGDTVVGYNGKPVKVLQKHEYLEDPTTKRFVKTMFKHPETNLEHVVDTCDLHRIMGTLAKHHVKHVVSREVYDGVNFSYDLVTEDAGYRISGVPVDSMVEELSLAIAERIKKQIN